MILSSKSLKSKYNKNIQTTLRPKQFTNIDLVGFNLKDHTYHFFSLFNSDEKRDRESSIEFNTFYNSFVKEFLEGTIKPYALVSEETKNVIGFIYFQEVFPHIYNAEFLLYPEFKNFQMAFNALKKAIEKLFSSECPQIVAKVLKSNQFSQVLFKQLGFDTWGETEKTVTFSLLNQCRKG